MSILYTFSTTALHLKLFGQVFKIKSKDSICHFVRKFNTKCNSKEGSKILIANDNEERWLTMVYSIPLKGNEYMKALCGNKELFC